MLKYLFTVTYKDGTQFEQTQEDKSSVDPQRSAFFDVKMDEVKEFKLTGDNKEYSVNLESGEFNVNGQLIIPNPTEYAQPETRKLIFFRVGQAQVIYPARFFGAAKARSSETGELIITDSKGEEHTFPPEAIVHQVKEEYTDDNGETTPQTVLEVFPHEPKDWTFYDIGYEGFDDKGNKVKKVIRFE